ncbi:GhoT/OrtT family toxin [Atlantibacter sp.]|uniref:GhoT/OrtT family toxin n=1 Tax=Atlantibacter sp. TaxID=1903473 RepID=UPI0013EF91A0|nr:GhoT/OrtT family toxin [Atlantibacter sp.]
MTLYQKMWVFYIVMASLAGLVTYCIAKDSKRIKFLSAALIGATWPMSFPVALLFALF